MDQGERPDSKSDPEYDATPEPDREDAHVEKRPGVKAYDAPEKRNITSWVITSALVVFAVLVVVFIIYAL